VQTFAARKFALRVLVDRYATCVYEAVPGSAGFRIVAGEATRLVAVAPTVIRPGRRFSHDAFETAGCFRVAVEDPQTGLSAETNPIMVRDGESHGHFWADLHGQTEETVGTNSIDDYFTFARNLGFLDACAHQGNDFQITDAFWKKIQQTTDEFNRPGRFVTFPGWEWSGNTGVGGDRNVLFRTEGGSIHRSCRALVDPAESVDECAEDAEALFDLLEGTRPEPMLFAHVGGRYADLAWHREGLETAVEVHSAWGTFEWMLADAFRLGYRVAIVANSDGHKGRPGASYPGASTFGSYGGLTCILAEALDRDSIWRAYQARRVYATTGARIALDVSTDTGAEIGSIVALDDEPPEFHVEVHGTAPIERVEFRNGMDVLKTVRPYGTGDLAARVKVLWQGAAVRGRGRQVNWDGELCVTGNRIVGFEPVSFLNLEKSCRRTGPRSLCWESITTGAAAGVILELKRPAAGWLAIKTRQKSIKIGLANLGLRGRNWKLGGIDKRLSVYRLPAAGGDRSLSFRFRPRRDQLGRGDNPLYVCVVQEDGQMAWSSPVYVVAGS